MEIGNCECTKSFAKNFADFVRYQRVKSNLTQNALAKMIGVSGASIHLIEKCAANISISTVCAICSIFDAKMGDVDNAVSVKETDGVMAVRLSDKGIYNVLVPYHKDIAIGKYLKITGYVRGSRKVLAFSKIVNVINVDFRIVNNQMIMTNSDTGIDYTRKDFGQYIIQLGWVNTLEHPDFEGFMLWFKAQQTADCPATQFILVEFEKIVADI